MLVSSRSSNARPAFTETAFQQRSMNHRLAAPNKKFLDPSLDFTPLYFSVTKINLINPWFPDPNITKVCRQTRGRRKICSRYVTNFLECSYVRLQSIKRLVVDSGARGKVKRQNFSRAHTDEQRNEASLFRYFNL